MAQRPCHGAVDQIGCGGWIGGRGGGEGSATLQSPSSTTQSDFPVNLFQGRAIKTPTELPCFRPNIWYSRDRLSRDRLSHEQLSHYQLIRRLLLSNSNRSVYK